ncbi:pyridoxamine 5'-phosphate oxidase family protein [Rhizobium sp. CC-YZS058]|uniref:pyridoxamine 5'-phosphate oxidase family protein n=1 Tax=Rhizobium sp. CC-YZS058 TaxID=3042153 RepID=UPI002B056565|nr:pyridoxamine 5'-phosphate oxidase family protein [Rhizobium sp. CC-YZS058]MEA3537452.1 pyridoxamine 5'-phosphate oxidase family protein [Rhizobium sp. CC-YZS058]
MPYHFLEVAVTPSVRAAQAEMGAEQIWLGGHDRPSDRFTESEIGFIAERDSFYMASVSETGWPYVQHRGGKAGFLAVLDEQTLAFPDYRGNRQYISAGNFSTNDRACLFRMDYPRRARLKIYAHVERLTLDEDPALTARLADPSYRGKPERIVKLRLEAFDWNCPQHIVPRYTEAQIDAAVRPLRDRLEQLESENAALRARLSGAEH